MCILHPQIEGFKDSWLSPLMESQSRSPSPGLMMRETIATRRGCNLIQPIPIPSYFDEHQSQPPGAYNQNAETLYGSGVGLLLQEPDSGVPARDLSPRLSEDSFNVPAPSVGSSTGYRVNRIESARQAQRSLDMYRAEPAAAPSVVLSTSSQAVYRTAFPAYYDNVNTNAGGSFQSRTLHQHHAQTVQQPTSAQITSTYGGAPGSRLLSRNWEPVPNTTNALNQRWNISVGDLKELGSPQRRAERAQVVLDKARPALVPTPESPVSPPHSLGSNSPRMRTCPGMQSAQTSPRVVPRSPLSNIKGVSTTEFLATPRSLSNPSPRLILTSPLGTRSLGLPRAASANLAIEVSKQQEKLQRREEHLRHGTWQQGRFRPPWDIMTEVGSVVDGESDIEMSLGEVNLSPSLVPRSPGQHVHSLHPTSTVDRGEFLDDQVDDPEQLECMSDVLSLLPPGLPTTLRTYLLLTILAEHYFDTLQQHLAIRIYLTYLVPPPPAGGGLGIVAHPPKAATFFTLGQMYLSTHFPLSALAAFEEAIACDPYDVASQVQVGFVNFLLDRHVPARNAYHRALLSMREADTVNYRVLGLDATVKRANIIQSMAACELTARREATGGVVGGGGVWGIGTGKIYRVPESKKRNIGRRKYFEQGKVVGRVLEVGHVGFGGTRQTAPISMQDFILRNPQHENQSDASAAELCLERILTSISNMSARSSPMGSSPLGDRWRGRGPRGKGDHDQAYEYTHGQAVTGSPEGSGSKEKGSRYNGARAEKGELKGKKKKGHGQKVSMDSLLDSIRRF